MRVEKLGPLTARILGGTDGRGGGDGPAVVLLHGFGAPGTDLVDLGRVLPAPEGTRFVFPEAPLELDLGFGLMDSRAWWMIDVERIQRAMMSGQLRDLTREVPDGLAAAREKLIACLDALETTLSVRGERMVLGGFSQGAMLSADVTLRTDRPIAGLALMSGTLLAEDEWLPLMPRRKGLKVFQSHGQMDPLLPFGIAVRLRDAMVAAGLDVDFVPFPGAHEIPRPALEGLVRLVSTALPTGGNAGAQ
jgi:phospholipase/carboxylesterase